MESGKIVRMRGGLEVRQEQVSLQAHFVKPAFGLLKETPDLARHLFEALASYGIRLADFKMGSSGDSFAEVNLQIALRSLVTARLFLDRVELDSAYLPFFNDFRGGAFAPDLLGAIQEYSSDVSYRAFAVTEEIHGSLDIPLKDFLARFSAAAPKTLGPALGSGTVFYFAPAENRLTGSLALDFSQVVDAGLFLKVSILFDAAQVEPPDLLLAFRSQFSSLVEEIGLDLIRRRVT